MVPTQELLNELTTMGFLRLHHVPRGVDTTRFDPAFRSSELRQAWGVDDDTLVLICVSRLAAEKNLSLVFQTYRRMVTQHPDIKLVLVGDGPLRNQLQTQYPEAIFAGFQTGKALSEHYASADIFMFASRTETFGNVTLEAMASGLAVVAFDHAAAGQLIQSGHNGMLARADSDMDFEMAVQTLLNNKELMSLMASQISLRVAPSPCFCSDSLAFCSGDRGNSGTRQIDQTIVVTEITAPMTKEINVI